MINLKELRKRQVEKDKELIATIKQKLKENIGLCSFFLVLGALLIFGILYESSSSETQQNAVQAQRAIAQAPPVIVPAPPVTVPTLPPEDENILVSSDIATVDLGTLSDFLNSMAGDTVVKIECKKYVSKPGERGDQAMGFSNFGYVISQFLKEPNDQFLTRFDFDVAGFSGQAGKIFVVNTIRYYSSPNITESNKLTDILNEDWGEGIGINDSWAKDVLKIHRKN